MKRTDKELLELDAWIELHVFRYKRGLCPIHRMMDCCGRDRLKSYTTDSTAAMMVLEKCLEQQGVVGLSRGKARGEIVYGAGNEIAETLPVAICLCARKLFNK